MKAIYLRGSVRQFTSQSVSIGEIEQLLRAGMAAPSAGNQQPWEFFVARDETTRLALAASSPYAAAAKKAPCVIVACQRTEGLQFPPCAPLDMSACVENILIEAADLGLGSCWMALYPDPDRVAAASVAIGAPKGLSPFALIAVGHPTQHVEPKGRSHYDETRVHWI